MSLMVEYIFPFTFLRKWSYTNSPLNQRKNVGLSSPPKGGYWVLVDYCTIKLGSTIFSQIYTESFILERSNHNPDMQVVGKRLSDYRLIEYHINGNQRLQKSWVMCCCTEIAKKYPINKKASEVLWGKAVFKEVFKIVTLKKSSGLMFTLFY